MIQNRIKANSEMSHEGVGDHEMKKYFLQILLDLRNQEDVNSLNITNMKAFLQVTVRIGYQRTY
ncbi:hypothetical protein Hanom_Chr05g00421311 [Helianthus anomalus]